MTTDSSVTRAQQIAVGYTFDGPALDLGSVVVDGSCGPTAQVRIPLATVNRHGLVVGATGTGKAKSLQVTAEQPPARAARHPEHLRHRPPSQALISAEFCFAD